MREELRLCFLILYALGPVISLSARLLRVRRAVVAKEQVQGWRWHVPTVLLPILWGLPPSLIVLGVGEVRADWLALRLVGLAISLSSTVFLVYACAILGRFLVHEAAVFQDHVLINRGPYRLVRHPIYSGYLALLLGSSIGMLNVYMLLFWPIALVGVLVEARIEENLLLARLGETYKTYVDRTGQLFPRLRGGLG